MKNKDKISQDPKKYIEQFNENVNQYIAEQYGTKKEFILKEIEFFEKVVVYIEYSQGIIELPTWDIPKIDNDIDGLLSEPEGYLLVNKCNRKIEFLKNKLVSISNGAPNISEIVKLSRVEAVELIRGLEQSDRLKVSLEQAYKFFGVKNGKVVSGEIKSRKKEPVAIFLNQLQEDFNTWQKTDNQ